MSDIDPARVAELTERERARAELLPRSIAFAKRARRSVEAFDAFATAISG